MSDDDEQQMNGRLHADLVLWEDAHRHAVRVRDQALADKKLAPATRAYWQGFVARMESHAAALGKKLKPQQEPAP
jgi:hypothetical protein